MNVSRKRVLLTGGRGFIGRNVTPIISSTHEVMTPTRQELDLKDDKAVRRFVIENDVDVIVHAANPNPVKNAQCDSLAAMFEDSMRGFMSIFNARSCCDQVLYLGSGAEYDKSLEIHKVKEGEAFRSLPPDAYGCAKFIMNQMASTSENVTNLRVFACFGPTDHESKFITHCIRCVLSGKPISIRQDCVFDYLHVSDLGMVVSHFIDNAPLCRAYNVASGRPVLLSEIARIVAREMGAHGDPIILNPGLNKEYTADVTRLATETGLVSSFKTLEEGIKLQIESERNACA